jgi:flagellar FliL protein
MRKTKAAAAETEPKQKKKRSKKKKLIIIAALVLVLGGGAGGYFMFSGGGSSTPPKPTPGKVIPLDAITINLSEGHYLKLKLALQGTSTAEAEMDGSKALDIAINEYSNRSVGELSSNAERDKSKKELVKKVSEAYEGKVMDIYFTEFVMQ